MFNDLLVITGMAAIGYVCYQISPLLAIGRGGCVLMYIGVTRAIVVRRTEKAKS